MDLTQNRLLGERHRASSTTHRLWRDFQRFVDTRVSPYIHPGTLSQRVEVSVDEEISALDQQTKLTIQ